MSSTKPKRLARALLAAATLLLPSISFADFGVMDDGTNYVVDSGAGLVFKIEKAGADIKSMVYQGVEYQDPSKGSHIVSGFGSATTVSAETIGSDYAKVTIQTDPTNGVVSSLTHYLIVRNGENAIHMATYPTAEPSVGELRWITRLWSSELPNGPIPSDLRGNSGTIESGDVYGMADGTTRSKYYGDTLTHGRDRAMDLSYCGATAPGVGVWMVYGNRESSSGGPFYRDIQNQCGSNQEIYNYMNSGHNQTEAYRLNVLHGPYSLVFNEGQAPSLPLDYSWIETGGLNLTGWVPDSGRGTVSGTVSGLQDGFEWVIGFANADAQYWATAEEDGSYLSPPMKPGSYTATLYQQELEVSTQSVSVSPGGNTPLNMAAPAAQPVLWRLGARDGTPAGFLNVDKVIEMHPSDLRMANWEPAPQGNPYVVGGPRTPETGIPCYQWKDSGAIYVQFPLTPAQTVDSTLRIGISAAFAGGRPGVSVNGGTSVYGDPSSQPSSRSLTLGTYRGNNAEYSYSITSGNLTAGTNTLRISVVSGAGTSGFLSAGYSIDYIELSGPASTSPPVTAGLVATAGDTRVDLSWDAVDWADRYVVERSPTSGGPFAVLTSNAGPHYTDSEVSNGLTYFYRVSAVNSAGTGPASPEASATPHPDPPSMPAGLVATASSDSQIDLTWLPSPDAESYNVKRATATGGPYATVATGITDTSFPDTGLSPNTAYHYIVSASNAYGDSADSTEAGATTFVNGLVAYATDSGADVSSATISGFSLGGGNALVVLVAAEGPDTSPSYAVTFGGINLTNQIANNEGNQGAAVFHIIDPPVASGDVVVFFDGPTRYAVAAMSLSDVSSLNDSASFASTAGSGSVTLPYTGTPQGIVVASLVDNDFERGTPTIAGDNISAYLTQIRGVSGDSAGRALAYGGIPEAGSYSETFAWGAADSTRNAGVLAAFELGTDDTTSPLPPVGLVATAGDGTVTLDWADNGEADLASYSAYRSTTSGAGYTAIASGLTASTFTDDTAVNGTPYYYVVTATDGASNESGISLEATATPQAPPPPPSGLIAMGISTNRINLSWIAPSGAVSYNIKRSTTVGGPYTTVVSGVATTGYNDTGLAAGIRYYYVVSAVGALGESTDSSEFSASTTATPLIHEAEQAVLSGCTTSTANGGYTGTGYADYQGASGDYVQWTISVASAGDYPLSFRYALGSGDRPLELKVNGVVVVASLGFPATGSWTNWLTVTTSAVLNAGTNAVRLTSIGSSGGNLDHLEVGSPLTSPPPAPTGLAATPLSPNGINLDWTASPEADSYNVKRSDVSGGSYTTVASGIAGTDYQDSGLPPGATYYYVVTAGNASGTSPDSAEVAGTIWTPGEAWRFTHFGSPDDTGDAANDQDPDNDGAVNLLERAFGGDPNLAEFDLLPRIDDAAPTLSILYRKAAEAADLGLAVEEAQELPMWAAATGSSEIVSDDGLVQTIRFTRPVSVEERLFLRVAVSGP